MNISELIRLMRPRTLTAAVSPVILGISSSFYFTGLPTVHLLDITCNEIILFIVALSAQIATNIWNEYFDYKSGLDCNQKVGNSGSIVKGHISPTIIKRLGLRIISITLLLGVFLAFRTTLWLIPIGVLCIAIAYCYSGGPYPISRTPFGELASGFSMGFTLVVLAAYLWVGHLEIWMLIPAIPSTILIGLILQANSIRDLNNDQDHGRRTLAILLGRDNAIRLMFFSYCFVECWIILWVILGVLPLTSLITLASFIVVFKSIYLFWNYSDVYTLDQAMKFSAITNTIYHLLLATSLCIAIWL